MRRRDWLGLIRYGVNFFVLEKFARVVQAVQSRRLRLDARRDARAVPGHAQRAGRALIAASAPSLRPPLWTVAQAVYNGSP